MNRLILVGNGFDLAHKLKTSYFDFISDYLTKSVNDFYTKFSSIDPLIEIRQKFAGVNYRTKEMATPSTVLRHLQELISSRDVNVSIKSRFLSDILTRLNKPNWVDLELEYFKFLLDCNHQPPYGSGFDAKGVQKLNMEFGFLENSLEKYLLRIEKENDHVYIEEYAMIFTEEIKPNEIIGMNISSKRPDRN